jgi:hypothetical protein
VEPSILQGPQIGPLHYQGDREIRDNICAAAVGHYQSKGAFLLQYVLIVDIHFPNLAKVDTKQNRHYPIPIQLTPQDFQCPKEDQKDLGKLNESKREAGDECVDEVVASSTISL